MSFTTRTKAPYRGDIVGSLIRPKELLDARKAFKEGSISAEELKAQEDKAIIEVIQKQVDAGLKCVSDGEFRRSSWHQDFFWGLGGIERFERKHGYFFDGIETPAQGVRVCSKISGENHPFVEHFTFTKAHTPEDIEAKQTIPGPAQLFSDLHRETTVEATKAHYPDDEELIVDIAHAYGQVLTDLYNAGATTVQLDDCSWSHLFSGVDPEEASKIADIYVRVTNLSVEKAPKELNITTHNCRGNYASRWFASGGYDSVAHQLFNELKVNAYYLEFDSERAGGFEPLQHLSEGKVVALGLVTTKTGELEDREAVKKRIEDASKFVDLDHLCLSTQCGFSSNEISNELTEEDQWAKIKTIVEIAQEVWGE